MGYRTLMIDEIAHASLKLQSCIERRSMAKIAETLIDEYVRSCNEKTNTSNQQSTGTTETTNT